MVRCSRISPTGNSGGGSHPPIDHFPPEPSPPITWSGLRALGGGKGYVSTPTGQVHYRDIGAPSDLPAIVLFHQSPQSMIQFAEVQNCLADRGIRSIAVDLPGYGMSDHPDFLPTVGGLADTMLALVDGLSMPKVVAAGHHTGAAVACALAARHPSRVAGVILHGLPLYTSEEAKALRGKELWDCTPTKDGSHMSQLFKWSQTGTDDELANLTWMSVGMLLQSRDIGHWAVDRNDMAADLMRIATPGMIISEVDDMTHHMNKRAQTMRPDFIYEQIDTPGNTMIMSNPERWALLAQKFITELPKVHC